MTNEAFARVRIDSQLQAQGWDIQDPNAVRFEVAVADGTRADYVLCDRHGRSLAVIEAKRFSVNPGDAACAGEVLCPAARRPVRVSVQRLRSPLLGVGARGLRAPSQDDLQAG